MNLKNSSYLLSFNTKPASENVDFRKESADRGQSMPIDHLPVRAL